MPELPEVETTIKHLRDAWLGKVITDVVVLNGGERQINLPVDELRKRLLGFELQNLERVGKWMLFRFATTETSQDVVGHLRMSGSYKVESAILSHPHARLAFKINTNEYINYIDQRRFGTWHLVNNYRDYLNLRNIGIDALSKDLSQSYLFGKIQQTARPIYTTLLDQKVIAGLGNIYVNEVLNRTKIHPLTPSKNIPGEKVAELVREIPLLLNQALELKGTTLKDNLYNTPEGKTGKFADLLQVYGKYKSNNVKRIQIGGRSVFFTDEQILY